MNALQSRNIFFRKLPDHSSLNYRKCILNEPSWSGDGGGRHTNKVNFLRSWTGIRLMIWNQLKMLFEFPAIPTPFASSLTIKNDRSSLCWDTKRKLTPECCVNISHVRIVCIFQIDIDRVNWISLERSTHITGHRLTPHKRACVQMTRWRKIEWFEGAVSLAAQSLARYAIGNVSSSSAQPYLLLHIFK